MYQNNQQETKKYNIVNTICRYTINEECVVNISFKTTYIDEAFKLHELSNTYYSNPFSYLEFGRKNSIDDGMQKFAVNFIEFQQIISKLENAVNHITANQKAILESKQLNLNFEHVCASNFKNAKIRFGFVYDTNYNKIFINMDYESPSDQKLFNVFSQMPYQMFKSFVEELKTIKSNWHVLQNQNFIMLSSQNNKEVNIYSQSSNDIGHQNNQPNNSIENHNSNNFVNQAESVMPISNNVQETNTAAQTEFLEGLDGFSNDALDDF